ncbi:MAG TPA: hypothetical protein VF828_03295 [Patescibacteria group bacterium]
MKLPNHYTKVTPFSKTLAFILFISMPFMGAAVGFKLGEIAQIAKSQYYLFNLSSKTNCLPEVLPTPTPQTPLVSPGNTKQGFIKGFSLGDKGYIVNVDFAQMLNGQKAKNAPNGYIISNPDKTPTELPVAKNVKTYSLKDTGTEPKLVSLSDFINYFLDPSTAYLKNALYTFKIANNQVVEISQIYTP